MNCIAEFLDRNKTLINCDMASQKIAEFIEHRKELSSEIMKETSFQDMAGFTLTASKHGKIIFWNKNHTETLRFSKHGQGFMFKNKQGIVVDYSEVERSSEDFNYFELVNFFGSLGSKFIRKHLGNSLEHSTQIIFDSYQTTKKQKKPDKPTLTFIKKPTSYDMGFKRISSFDY